VTVPVTLIVLAADLYASADPWPQFHDASGWPQPSSTDHYRGQHRVELPVDRVTPSSGGDWPDRDRCNTVSNYCRNATGVQCRRECGELQPGVYAGQVLVGSGSAAVIAPVDAYLWLPERLSSDCRRRAELRGRDWALLRQLRAIQLTNAGAGTLSWRVRCLRGHDWS